MAAPPQPIAIRTTASQWRPGLGFTENQTVTCGAPGICKSNFPKVGKCVQKVKKLLLKVENAPQKVKKLLLLDLKVAQKLKKLLSLELKVAQKLQKLKK